MTVGENENGGEWCGSLTKPKQQAGTRPPLLFVKASDGAVAVVHGVSGGYTYRSGAVHPVRCGGVVAVAVGRVGSTV